VAIFGGRSKGVCCLTIDNLGEAAEIGEGSWPSERPVGRHFTLSVVQRLLGSLEVHKLTATFFIEAMNAELYPELLREIVDRGHEVGCHAWQHERWNTLSRSAERSVLARSTRAFRDLAVEPVGFRPPGGQITAHTPELLRELGYRYHSPAGSRAGIADGLAVIPFEWRMVDAFFYASSFAGLRERYRSAPVERPASVEVAECLLDPIRDAAASRSQATVVFHPLLLREPAAFEAFEHVLAGIDELVAHGRLECLTMAAYAERLLTSTGTPVTPLVDEATWATA